MTGEILLIFVLALGVVLIGWCLMGLLLLPVFTKQMVTLCFAKGTGSELEQQVRAYGWLRDGAVSGGRLVIVDCGLEEEGRRLAEILQHRYHWVRYCLHAELADYLERMEDTI